MSDNRNLLNAVIDEALEREQRSDDALKLALSQLSPFEMWTVVEGIAEVVRRHDARAPE